MSLPWLVVCVSAQLVVPVHAFDPIADVNQLLETHQERFVVEVLEQRGVAQNLVYQFFWPPCSQDTICWGHVRRL